MLVPVKHPRTRHATFGYEQKSSAPSAASAPSASTLVFPSSNVVGSLLGTTILDARTPLRDAPHSMSRGAAPGCPVWPAAA